MCDNFAAREEIWPEAVQERTEADRLSYTLEMYLIANCDELDDRVHYLINDEQTQNSPNKITIYDYEGEALTETRTYTITSLLEEGITEEQIRELERQRKIRARGT